MPKADSYVDSFASVKKSYIITLVFASLLVIAISGLDSKQYENFSLTGPRSSNKPYKNFETFYPFYLSEHSELTNRRLHLLGRFDFATKAHEGALLSRDHELDCPC